VTKRAQQTNGPQKLANVTQSEKRRYSEDQLTPAVQVSKLKARRHKKGSLLENSID
jgi:hypothetical protein